MYQGLRQLGLTKYETKIYRSLLTHGKLLAKQIAEISNVPPTAVYPNLKSLLQKQLIKQFTGKIRAYEVLDPKVSIPAFIERKRKQFMSLQHDLIEQAKELAGSQQDTVTKEVIHLTQGKEASEAIYRLFEEKAKKSLYIMGWLMYKIKDKYPRLAILKKLLQRGVDIRIILIGTKEKQLKLIKAYQEAGVKIRYLPLENFSLVVCDGEECKITLKSQQLPDKFNVFIHDTDLASAMQNYFLMTWEKAEEI